MNATHYRKQGATMKKLIRTGRETIEVKRVRSNMDGWEYYAVITSVKTGECLYTTQRHSSPSNAISAAQQLLTVGKKG